MTNKSQYIEISQDINTHTCIGIDLGDGTHLHISADLSDPDWRIRFNTKTKVYSTTSGTWCVMLKPNGVQSEWMMGKDIDTYEK